MPDNKRISELGTAATLDGTDLLEIAQVNAGSSSGYASAKTTMTALANKIAKGIQFGDLQTTAKDLIDAINEAAVSGGNSNIADDYDNTQTYVVGDYCIYEGDLYRCITAVTSAESFDSTKWTAVLVTDELGQGGTTVIANPQGTPTDELQTIQIGNDIYEIVGGGGGGNWVDVKGTLTAGQTSITLTNANILTTSTLDFYTDKFGVNPTNVVVSNGSVTLTFDAQSSDLAVKVRVTNEEQFTVINMSSIQKFCEYSMNYTASESSIISDWNGGSAIGATCYISVPIDVTDYDTLKYNLVTRNCWGNGSQSQQERWNVMVGLMQNAPTRAIQVAYESAGFAAGDDFANSNTDYGTQEIDVSNLSGNYYFVIASHGWNATISDLKAYA